MVMKKTAFISALLMGVSATAFAQTATQFSPNTTILSSSVNAAFGSKADILNGVLNSPTLNNATTNNLTSNNGTATGLLLNNATITGATVTGTDTQFYCPTSGCIPGNHLGGDFVINANSLLDEVSQETAQGINFVANTGGNFVAWAPNTAYGVGRIVLNNNNFWQVVVAGTSGSSGGPTIPSNLPATGDAGSPNQTDGSITWAFYSAGVNNGKEGLSIAVRAMAGSGSVWGMDTDLVIDPGRNMANNFTANFEADTANNAQDCPPGVCSVFGLWESGGGNYDATAALYVTGYTHGWHIGLLIDSAHAIVDDAIHLSDSGTNGLVILGSHTGNDIYISSVTPPVSEEIDGYHNTADLNIGSTSPVSIRIGGSHAAADLNDVGIGPVGLNVAGQHTGASVSTINDTAPYSFQAAFGKPICWGGIAACVTYNLTSHQFVFTDENNVRVASLGMGSAGMILKGPLVQNGTP